MRRYAPVLNDRYSRSFTPPSVTFRMTRGEGNCFVPILNDEIQQIPPLRFASVGMTMCRAKCRSVHSTFVQDDKGGKGLLRSDIER